MAKYFSYFPRTSYKPIDGGSDVDVVTNITTRFKMENSIKENSAAYYKYDVVDGDTPEIVAYKYYGSAEKHWIVLMMNDIIDPQYDWPLEYRTLSRFVDNKYSANNYADTANTKLSGLNWSRQNIHAYYITETTEYSGNTFSQTLQLDSATYANTVTGSRTITLQDGNQIEQSNVKFSKNYYEYEYDENEKKRSIILLKPELALNLEEELRKTLL
jgi:hypothetical protein